MSVTDSATAPPPTGGSGRPLLLATGMGKSYQGIAALTDVTVSVDAGELVALIGPNGAGKSTLFDCMSGVQTPDHGRVLFDGHDLHGMARYRRARLGLARTFQRIELFPGLTRARPPAGRRPGPAPPRAPCCATSPAGPDPRPTSASPCDAVLEQLGLSADAERPAEAPQPRARPGGRAGPGADVPAPPPVPRRAVVGPRRATRPTTWPTVLEAVQRDQEIAIVLCEHDVALVERLASRTYVLDTGRLIAEGPTAEVMASPRVRAAYLGA